MKSIWIYKAYIGLPGGTLLSIDRMAFTNNNSLMQSRLFQAFVALLAPLWLAGSNPVAAQAARSSEFMRLRSSQHPANARSCAECHSTPNIGGSSRRAVMRAGSFINGKYIGVKKWRNSPYDQL